MINSPNNKTFTAYHQQSSKDIAMKYSHFYVSALTLLASHALQAHVSVDTANGPAIAGKSYLVTLNLPHGCSGSDTYKIEVEIPSGFKLSRPVDSEFGAATITKETLAVPFVMHGKNYEEDVTKITWEKPESEIKASDTHLYRVSFRSTLPDTPFATAYLKTTQTCKMPDGSTEKLEWVGTGGHDDHSATLSPAPAMFIYPARTPGWNQYTVSEHVHDLSIFKDAEIVWAGTEAYSPNANTSTLIEQDADTQTLQMIHPGTDIWVKY
jgi:uncharacterized protein YcnI